MRILVLKEFYDNKLLESKSISFNGELSPQFGWAVIMAGGAGSGKGFVIDKYIHLPSTISDVDELKKKYIKLKIKKIDDDEYKYDGITFDEVDSKIKQKIYKKQKLTSKEINEVIDTILGNKRYVSVLHGLVKKKGWKDEEIDNILNNANPKRLPNIIFDMTGDEEKKLINTANKVRKYGYKTALVWVVTNISVAEFRNANRKRKVSDKILQNTHEGAKRTIINFLENNAANYFDEAWVVINSAATNSKPLTKEENKILKEMPSIQLIKNGTKFDFSNNTKKFLLQFLEKDNEDNSSINYLSILKEKSKEKQRRQLRPVR